MYESFYQLQSNPFSLAPDPHFCFNHAGHQQAREYLEYALNLGEGLVMITGRPGTGKTTLVESFLANMHSGAVVAAHMAVSHLDSDDMLRAVAYAFDIEAEGHDKATLRYHIRKYLESLHERGRRALLIIDEAQGLPHAALDELRLLADLQLRSQQLLQLFFVGQEQLHDLLSEPDMDYFQQRVIANYHLVPLDLKETRAYIEYRLQQAGWRGEPTITGAAVYDIYQFSGGVPRHINKLCNRLMLLGYGKACHSLGRREVTTITAEMSAEHLRPIELRQVANGDSVVTSGRSTAPTRAELAKLAIKAKKRASMAAVHFGDPAPPGGTDAPDVQPGDAVVPPERSIVPVPAAAMLAAARAPAGRYGWQKRAGYSLVVMSVAILTFMDMTNVLWSDKDSLPVVSAIDAPAGMGGYAWNHGEGSGTVIADRGQYAPDTDQASLQQWLNDELPAPASGTLRGDDEDALVGKDDSPLQAAREFLTPADELDYLLASGKQALAEDRLLTPALDSAYHYYQSALRLDPGNATAAGGIDRIVQRYVALGTRALDKQNGLMANRYIARGLSIQPDNSELLALRAKSVVPIIGADGGADASQQTAKKFLTRVKTFFSENSRVSTESAADYQMTSSFLYE